MNMASSSSSSADILPQQKYDVFLSFRGQDTRQTFTSHLRAALDRKKIYTYIDDRLERGDEIRPALFTAIEQSKLSVIIFSKDYASSSWCLDEVVHILKCKEENEQLVIPVFYDIDPSHVRWQQGTYADAFAIIHEERFKDNMDKVRKWRDALRAAANLSGFSSQDIRVESELVEKIIEDISTKLNRNSSFAVKGLVGIESRIQQIEFLLCINTQDVCYRTVGIWGMGGIGKTTLADAIFHKHSSKFDAYLFLANVREESEKHGLNHLRNELLRELLKEENLSIGSLSIGSTYVIDRLSRTKVLVVFDDVSDLDQLEFLLGDQIQFGPGSRIIITTRNRCLLKKIVHEDHIYKVNELSVDEALGLFQSITFEDDSYSNLSRKVVDYAGCNPLALKVLASSFLHCNDREDWEEEFNKLKKFPNTKIQNALRISYNGLQDHEKGVFLDIACFLKGTKRSKAERMLEMHGFYKGGIKSLIHMSLISISVENHIEMHDLLQEMGRSIVCEQCTHTPGKRSRLWKAEDVYQVLKYKTGTGRVEAIFLDRSNILELKLSHTTFENMHKLMLLKVYASNSNVDNKVHLPNGLRSVPEDLRYLYWESYPSESLPSEFSPRNLVELHMPHGKVKKLWDNNGQYLGKLKKLKLSDCKHLTEVPDLSRCPNIETLILSGCTSLVQLPSYVKKLDKLTTLKLGRCSSLTSYPEMPRNMPILDLSYSQLTEVPDLSRCPNIEKIYLDHCASLVQVPNAYFRKLAKLTTLNMAHCSSLKTSPEVPCNLRILDLSSCFQLTEVPDLSQCPNIEEIDLCSCTSLVQVPNSFIKNLDKLAYLKMANCSSLKASPEIPRNMRKLDLSSCSQLTEVPDLSPCPNLEEIDLCRCTSLVQVPNSFIKNLDKLAYLKMAKCSGLKASPEIPRNMRKLDLSSCSQLTEVPDLSRCPNLETLDLCRCTSLVQVPSSYVSNLDKLTFLYMERCTSLKVSPKIPRNVRKLYAGYCSQLTEFPDVSGCQNIEKIDLTYCTSLVQVPSYIINLHKLHSLKLADCSSLKTFPEIPCNMGILDLSFCCQLTEVPDFSRYPNTKIDVRGCTSLDQAP